MFFSNKKPTTVYQECPEEGDSFESVSIDTNLVSVGRSAAAPTASSSIVPVQHTANGSGTASSVQQVAKPPRTSSSSASRSNNKGKKVKKERTPLSFFNVRKTKERTVAFALLEQSKNQKVRCV
jgi:hypothetical protein